MSGFVLIILFFFQLHVILCAPNRFFCYEHDAKKASKLQLCPGEVSFRSCSSMIFNGVDVPFFGDANVSCVSEESFRSHPVYKGLPSDFCFCGIEGWFGNITYCWCWCEGSGCNTEERMRNMYTQCLEGKGRRTEPSKSTIRESDKQSSYEKYFCEIGFAKQPGNATFVLVEKTS